MAIRKKSMHRIWLLATCFLYTLRGGQTKEQVLTINDGGLRKETERDETNEFLSKAEETEFSSLGFTTNFFNI